MATKRSTLIGLEEMRVQRTELRWEILKYDAEFRLYQSHLKGLQLPDWVKESWERRVAGYGGCIEEAASKNWFGWEDYNTTQLRP